MSDLWIFLAIGAFAGVASGVFGVGGGVVIVPALVTFAGFSQHRATGTSLAVLLPPIGLAAVLEYHRNGNVDLRAAFVIAAALFVGAGGGAWLANRLPGPALRFAFGLFLAGTGVSLVITASRRLGWL
jgi:uncharacterized membrane protein YfcA